MPRLTPIETRDQVATDKRHVFDYLEQTRGQVRGPLAVLLNNPEVCHRVAHLGTFVRFESSLPKHVLELVALTASCELQSRSERSYHLKAAPEAGVSAAAVSAAEHGTSLDGIGPAEAELIRWTRQLVRDHDVSDADFAAIQKRFGNEGAIDYLATVGYYSLIAPIFNALGIG